jgi:hypothetical protein
LHGRLYRDQELVWLVLDEPLRIDANFHLGKDHTVRFWPGVVRRVVSPAPDQRTEGSETRYLVTIISVKRSYFVPQKRIIPFNAYNLDEDALANLRLSGMGTPRLHFHPLPQSAAPGIPSLSGPVLESFPLELLIMDVKMAKHIATTWAVTDGYSLTNQQPAGGTPPRSPAIPMINSLRVDALHAGPPPPHPPIEGQSRRRYRGLWWGVERIWVGDLLVLSFPEGSISYTSKDSTCFVPAPVEDSTGSTPPDHRGPEGRRVFLKLRALVAVRAANGVGMEVEAIGSVYKLVPSLTSVQAKAPNLGDLGLPRPPDGFVFRAVLTASIEVQLPLRLIRGRYYPQLLSLVDERFVPAEAGLKAMEGLGPVSSAAGRPSKHMVASREDVLSVAQGSANRNS